MGKVLFGIVLFKFKWVWVLKCGFFYFFLYIWIYCGFYNWIGDLLVFVIVNVSVNNSF